MHFIIFHGSFGNPSGNWFLYLKEQLEALGHQVMIPTFPVDDWDELTKNGPNELPQHQSLENWLQVFEPITKTLNEEDRLCFIGHSLGSLFILHVVEAYHIQLDSAIFVSPFLETLHKSWQIDAVNKSFYRTDFDFNILKKFIPISYVFYGNNDPYVDRKYPLDFAKEMGSIIKEIKNGGHLNTESGYKEFPLLLELCIARTTRN